MTHGFPDPSAFPERIVDLRSQIARIARSRGLLGGGHKRATTNVQHRFVQFFYYLFFSFVLIELKPFVLKGKALGEKV